MRSAAIAAALVLCSSLAVAACDRSGDKVKAEVTNAVATSSAKVEGTHEILAIATGSSKVEFVGYKAIGKHDGSFSGFTGSVDLVDGNPEKSTVTIDLDPATVTTDDEKLTAHLKSKDFFDVAAHPKASFVSTSIKKQDGPKGATHLVTGNLELRGVKKSVTFPAKVTVSPDGVSAAAEFTINRKDFDIVYAGMADNLIKDDVTIRLDVKAPRKKG